MSPRRVLITGVLKGIGQPSLTDWPRPETCQLTVSREPGRTTSRVLLRWTSPTGPRPPRCWSRSSPAWKALTRWSEGVGFARVRPDRVDRVGHDRSSTLTT